MRPHSFALGLVLWSSIASADPRNDPLEGQHFLNPKIAACLIQRRPEFISAWMRTLSGSEAERKLVRPMEADFSACFSNGPWMPMGWAATYNYQGMREGLIEALLAPRLASLPALPPAGLDRVNWYADSFVPAKDGKAAAALTANALGFCLAKTDWTATRALLMTTRGSAAEQQAIAKLTPQLPSCILPGQKLVLDRARLRAILAETAYHALDDPRRTELSGAGAERGR